jgi:sec-independent protein translocase protein TatA
MELLVGLGPIGPVELVIVLVIVVLIFGVGRLPEVGGAIGKGIREFRHATKDDEKDASVSNAETDTVVDAPAATPTAPAQSHDAAVAPAVPLDTVFCGECGASNPRGAKFCAECGKAIGTPVG